MMKTFHHFAWKILEWRKNPYCRNCRKKTHIMVWEGSWKDQATVDHILSRGMGGTDTEDNFQLLCGKCNNEKSKSENVQEKGKYVPKQQLEALLRKSALLDALRKEGIKKLPIWEAAQLRLKNAVDNLPAPGYNPDGDSRIESDS
jgi:hypothetical protein